MFSVGFTITEQDDNMGNDLANTLVGGAIGILAIHEVGEMVQGRRRRNTTKRTTSHNKATKSRPSGKSTTSSRSKAVKGRVVHKGARGGKYIIRHGNKVYV